MCLVVIAFDTDPEWPLLLAANRDEFHARPTRDAEWWPDDADILGGRDLLAGGSWLAVHRDGRFATVTNYRDAAPKQTERRSRGELVTGFLSSSLSPMAYLAGVDGAAYDGFNLLVGNRVELGYLSNQESEPRQLSAGVYGIANDKLDSRCDKVRRSTARMRQLLVDGTVDEAGLMGLLSDRDRAPAAEVSPGRLPFEAAHATTAPFIVLPEFGTRCSTVITANRRQQYSFLERRFNPLGEPTGDTHRSFGEHR
jgi:uncharacterized protein with NRDE domain